MNPSIENKISQRRGDRQVLRDPNSVEIKSFGRSSKSIEEDKTSRKREVADILREETVSNRSVGEERAITNEKAD